MRRNALGNRLLMIVVVATLLAGCPATRQARELEPEGFLVNPAILSKGENGQALYYYRNPQIDLKNYSKVLIEPIRFFKPAQASPEEVADLQKLANNFNLFLLRELSGDYAVVTAPAAGTLRIETAITAAGKSRPTMDFISTVVPGGLAVSVLTDFVTGKPLSVGRISGELKITDAVTGELVSAAVDGRVGGKSLAKGDIFSSWNDANNAMEYWAIMLRQMLCTGRGAANCVTPAGY